MIFPNSVINRESEDMIEASIELGKSDKAERISVNTFSKPSLSTVTLTLPG